MRFCIHSIRRLLEWGIDHGALPEEEHVPLVCQYQLILSQASCVSMYTTVCPSFLLS